MGKACRAAYRRMERPEHGTSIKDAAWQVMEQAYDKASTGRTLPANARQIMYAARGDILRLTGKDKLSDVYFTQTLLPDYVAEHKLEEGWDVVYDARGSLIEPHTEREIRLGTIEVRDYLDARPPLDPVIKVGGGSRSYPTMGPENRYRNVLYIEKEGFAPLLSAARIAERFDIAIMSNKGVERSRGPDTIGPPGAEDRQTSGNARLRCEWVYYLRNASCGRPSLQIPEQTSNLRYRIAPC